MKLHSFLLFSAAASFITDVDSRKLGGYGSYGEDKKLCWEPGMVKDFWIQIADQVTEPDGTAVPFDDANYRNGVQFMYSGKVTATADFETPIGDQTEHCTWITRINPDGGRELCDDFEQKSCGAVWYCTGVITNFNGCKGNIAFMGYIPGNTRIGPFDIVGGTGDFADVKGYIVHQAPADAGNRYTIYFGEGAYPPEDGPDSEFPPNFAYPGLGGSDQDYYEPVPDPYPAPQHDAYPAPVPDPYPAPVPDPNPYYARDHGY
mmetsp:Transcript_13294/g.23920  ORF Transcript_13294/g.23920 Transcript_13294/m.23920 type:complete len:261 (+) Transcript_13294:59-841(+)